MHRGGGQIGPGNSGGFGPKVVYGPPSNANRSYQGGPSRNDVRHDPQVASLQMQNLSLQPTMNRRDPSVDWHSQNNSPMYQESRLSGSQQFGHPDELEKIIKGSVQGSPGVHDRRYEEQQERRARSVQRQEQYVQNRINQHSHAREDENSQRNARRDGHERGYDEQIRPRSVHRQEHEPERRPRSVHRQEHEPERRPRSVHRQEHEPERRPRSVHRQEHEPERRPRSVHRQEHEPERRPRSVHRQEHEPERRARSTYRQEQKRRYEDNGYRRNEEYAGEFERDGREYSRRNDGPRSGGYVRSDDRENHETGGIRSVNYRIRSERTPRDWQPESEPPQLVQQGMRSGAKMIDVSRDRKVTIRYSDVKARVDSWDTSGLHHIILSNIAKCGYTEVRPIQAAIIPQIMRGYDVMGRAETGGGKTAAFALPIIHKIMTSDVSDIYEIAPVAFILVPSRELVKQIYNNINVYAQGTGVKVGFTYGETPPRENLAKLRQGCHILVGTCGRVMDYVEKGQVIFDRMKFFVLDEADKMLNRITTYDNGDDHLQNIMDNARFRNADKQLLLFSATLPEKVVNWMERSSKRRTRTGQVVTAEVESGRLNPRIDLEFVNVKDLDRLETLYEYVDRGKRQDGRMATTMIFVQEKQRTDFVALELTRRGYKARAINGDRSQDQREEAMKLFCNGTIQILVSTDVCSRGLDIPGLDRVINYEVPLGIETEILENTFINRSGRTGRKTDGVCITFVDPTEPSDTILFPFFVQCYYDINKPKNCPDFLRTQKSSRLKRAPSWKPDSENEFDEELRASQSSTQKKINESSSSRRIRYADVKDESSDDEK